MNQGRFQKYRIERISDPREWKRTTGYTAPVMYPAFAVQGGREQILGYVDAPGLIQSILKILVGAGKLIYNIRHRDEEIGSIPPSPPKEEIDLGEPQPFIREPELEEAPKPKEPTLDWTHASIVFVIPEKIDVGGFKGLLIGKAEEIASGIITRKLFDATDGKVSPQFVFARTTPERYKAVSETLEAESGIFILVARQDVGFLKGLAVKKVESTLPDKLKKLPIEVIFERTQLDVYVGLEAALRVEEPLPISKVTQGKKEGFDLSEFLSDPKTYTLSMLGGLLVERLQDRAAAWWRRRKKLKPVTGET